MPVALGRVLVVDDYPVIRQLIRVILELDGFEVVTVADGAECMDTVPWFRPDVITLDMAMPGMDGPRTVRALRENPRTVHLPLVQVSAAVETYIPVDVDAVVAKPFEPAELAGHVRRLARTGRPHGVQPANSLAG
ncbi:response regulator [Streptomyces calidiresistens]|uniref:Response regulator n=1 Tax=Streptomyces calidiresistens TaxID=1485586 RepID=A0A7W3SZV4_9ACTN|nr:response regulator [Streptomyces calidiresistens]MBB0228389.1 response regulator [Streptomyces calidiresistens]